MKKLIVIASSLLLVLAISGLLYRRHLTSPTYSLRTITRAIQQHDVTTFEQYVDLDSVSARALAELPGIFGTPQELGLFGEQTAEIVLALVKEPFVNIIKQAVQTFIERGHFNKSLTEKGSLSKLFKLIPADSIELVSLQIQSIAKKYAEQGDIAKALDVAQRTGNYLRGTTVNLSAQPAPGWEFLSWTGDASGTSSNISLVMDRDKSVTARFGQTLFTLTVTTVGGGAVSGNTQSNYSRGTAVNLSAEPAPGWYFQNWSGDASGTSRNVSMVMDRDKSVLASFAPLTLLAVTAGGGTIAANPASNYVQGSAVELSAQPQSGWTFLNWMGDASGTNPQASVTMDRPKEVQAVFGTECKTTVLGQGAVVRDFGTGPVPFGTVLRLTAIPQPGNYFGLWGNAVSSVVNPLDFTVTNATPTVGAMFMALGVNQATLTVLEQGAGIVTREPLANAYTKGQAVRLTARPFPHQDFLGWAGDASGAQNPLTVTVTTNQTITATRQAVTRWWSAT